MRWRFLAASVCATDTDSTKPMIEISTADINNWPHNSGFSEGAVSGGKPIGTSPTIATPLFSKSKTHTARVVTATAPTGPALAKISANRGFNPRPSSKGFSPLRTQNKNATVLRPINSVIGFVRCWLAINDEMISGRACPWAEMPKICFNWLVAISTPDAVINPAITGCDRKFAKNPRRSTPISVSMTPEIKARVMAAAAYSAGLCSPRLPTAAAVISDTTATGPTASARLVPKIA